MNRFEQRGRRGRNTLVAAPLVAALCLGAAACSSNGGGDKALPTGGASAASSAPSFGPRPYPTIAETVNCTVEDAASWRPGAELGGLDSPTLAHVLGVNTDQLVEGSYGFANCSPEINSDLINSSSEVVATMKGLGKSGLSDSCAVIGLEAPAATTTPAPNPNNFHIVTGQAIVLCPTNTTLGVAA